MMLTNKSDINLFGAQIDKPLISKPIYFQTQINKMGSISIQ